MDVVADVRTDYGSLILGGLLAFGLSGCVSMQFIMYWQIYPGQQWATKVLVITTWLLDLCHSALLAVAIWDSVVSHYGDLEKTNVIPWSVGPTVQLTAMVTFLVQSFFAHRIYRLHNRKLTVAGPVFALAFIRLVAASVSMAEIISLKYYTEFVKTFPSWVFTLGLSLSAFVDIVITTSLCYFLRLNRSMVPSTNHIIGILTLWTVQNGSITCLGTIASLVCWLAMPQNRIFLGIHFLVPKLHANCLLATLNARNKIRKSRKHLTTSQPPIGMFPESAFVHEGDRSVSPKSLQSYTTRFDPFAMQTVDLTRTKSIEVSIQRTIEARYDRDVDVLSVAAETSREASMETWGPEDAV